MSLKKIVKGIFFGKKTFQPFFKRLFFIAIEGMNIGTGGGSHNNGEAFVLRKVLQNELEPTVFDVGAQGGDYSLQVLEVTNNKAKVYAFEPRKKDFDILKEILGTKVNLVQSALGERDGESELFYPENISGLSSFHKPNEGFSKSEKVKIQTIDTFCKVNNVSNITLLKLDVEGHELACLRGAKNILPNIKYIQFEFSIRSQDARVYFRDIFDVLSDYKIYRILRNGLYEVKQPDRLTEMLFTTNYLAERKS